MVIHAFPMVFNEPYEMQNGLAIACFFEAADQISPKDINSPPTSSPSLPSRLSVGFENRKLFSG